MRNADCVAASVLFSPLQVEYMKCTLPISANLSSLKPGCVWLVVLRLQLHEPFRIKVVAQLHIKRVFSYFPLQQALLKTAVYYLLWPAGSYRHLDRAD